MIDIHSHILFGLDDGAETLEESVGMARMAAAAGTTDMVATPHANQVYEFDPQIVESKIVQLQAAVGETLRIHYGCELHLTMENIEDALRSPEKYTINHRGYLLVEFSDLLVPKTIGEILARILAAGMRPMVAHPERNPLLQKRVGEMQAWIAQGASLQVTAQSLLGRYGRSAKASAHELLRSGMVHVLASDAHDLEHRPTALDESRAYVEREFGQEAAERLLEENPRCVLAGAAISGVSVAIKPKKWFRPW